MKVCEVSKRAHDRGYGTASEIVLENYRPKDGWPFDIARYLNLKTTEKGNNNVYDRVLFRQRVKLTLNR